MRHLPTFKSPSSMPIAGVGRCHAEGEKLGQEAAGNDAHHLGLRIPSSLRAALCDSLLGKSIGTLVVKACA